ncbi:MAG: NUDIX hydrolase [Armatimonadetes bacterium]|nr:NUDIX hydrolase [Armatimonadota bacterium]
MTERLDSRMVFEGHVVKVRVDRVRLSSGRETDREVVVHPDTVAVAALTPDGKLVLIHQYRHPVGRQIWEVPAGKIDPGEEPEPAMRRELMEECGLEPGSMELLGSFYLTPGYCTEKMHLYLARDCTQTLGVDAEEDIAEMRAVTLAQAEQMIAAGEIVDAKTMLAVALLS